MLYTRRGCYQAPSPSIVPTILNIVTSSNTAYMSAQPSILGSAKLRQGPGVVLIMLDLCLERHLAARPSSCGKKSKNEFCVRAGFSVAAAARLGAGGGSEWIRMCITARNMGY